MCGEFADALFVQVGNSESAIFANNHASQLPLLSPPLFTRNTEKLERRGQMFLKYAWSAQFVFSPRFIVGPYLSSRSDLKMCPEANLLFIFMTP